MTTVDIVATVTISIVVLFLVVIPVIRIFFKRKYFKKLSLVDARETKQPIQWDDNDTVFKNHNGLFPQNNMFPKLDDDFFTNPAYSYLPGNAYHKNKH